jgi:hypothetical protein
MQAMELDREITDMSNTRAHGRDGEQPSTVLAGNAGGFGPVLMFV